MTIAWMLYVLLVGGMIACAAVATEGVMRRMAVPARWVWVVALGAIVGLAIIAPGQGDLVMPTALGVARSTPGTMTPRLAFTPGVTIRSQDRIASAIISGIARVASRVPAAVVMPLAVAWSSTSAVLLLVITMVNLRVNRARRAWPLAEMDGTPVRIASDVGPAVMGLVRPEIVVPRWLLNRTRDEQRLVMAHEREHVIAHDQLLPIAAWVVAALLPWHPAIWWALSRLRLAIELDCDTRVLNRGVHARHYGDLLIDIAGQCAGHRVGALALVDRTSHLERRLLAMKPTRSRFVFARTGVLGAIAMSAILVACESRLPTSADISAMDVASAEKAAADSHIFGATSSDDGRAYFVNDSAVTAAYARSISPRNIDGIVINKATSGGSVGEIRITTKKNTGYANTAGSGDDKASVHFNIRGAGDTLSARVSLDTGRMTVSSGHMAIKMATNQNPQGAKRFEGVVFIDGTVSSMRAMAEIPPADIVSVDVIKGEAAMRESNDPAAANGIIKVTTKHGAPAANARENH